MKVYIFKKDWEDAVKGTKLFLQDGVYYYKTSTEEDRWLDVEFVETNEELFRPQNGIEFFYHVKMD